MSPNKKSSKLIIWKNLMASNKTESRIPAVANIATVAEAKSKLLMIFSTLFLALNVPDIDL